MGLSKKAQRAVDRDLAMLQQTGRLELRKEAAPKAKAKASGSKTKASGSKAKTSDSKAKASGSSARSTATPALDEEAMAKRQTTWDEAAEALKAMPRQLLEATASELEREAILALWRLGYVYLRFAGVGIVHSVLNLTDDPNDRHNPRALNPVHVASLGQTFSMTGGKQDRETPIYIKCSPDIIEPACLAAMKDPGRTVSARDLDFSPPALQLKRPNPDLEDRLETEVWLMRDQTTPGYITLEDVAIKQAQLDEMRKARPRATLVNGNHRTGGMLAACVVLHKIRDDIISRDKAGLIAPEDLAVELKRLGESVMNATYRCEVYRGTYLGSFPVFSLADAGSFSYPDDTPQSVLAMLSENTAPRESLPADRGERVWSLGERIAGAVKTFKASGETREEAMNRAVGDVRAGRGMIMADAVPEAAQGKGKEKAKEKVKPKGGKKNGQGSGQGKTDPDEEIVDLLLKRSTTVRMMLETRSALWVYSNLVTKAAATAMAQPAGASLTGHFWLGTLCMLKILNVANGNGLTETEGWVQNEPLTVDGSAAATRLWNDLHAREKTLPTYMDAYAQVESVAFGKLLEKARGSVRSDDGSIDWTSEATVLAMRGVYDEFAKVYDKSKAEWGRWIAASLRLFARLPIWKAGQRSPAFYPAAALPSSSWISSKVTEANAQQTAIGTEASMAVKHRTPRTDRALALTFFFFSFFAPRQLEILIDPWQLPWTQGAKAGNTNNYADWYRRLQGSHQVLMWCRDTKQAGDRATRLMTAIRILNDARFTAGICAFREPFEKQYATLNNRCSANKSAPAQYGIVSTLVERHNKKYGGESKTHDLFDKARAALAEYVFNHAGADKDASIDPVLAAHPVLKLIPAEFWASFDIRRWSLGWNDQPSKQRKTITAAVGWGLLINELLYQLLQRLLDSPSVGRWLLHVARELYDMRGLEVWWPAGQYSYSMPSPELAPEDQPEPTEELEALPEPAVEVEAAPPAVDPAPAATTVDPAPTATAVDPPPPPPASDAPFWPSSVPAATPLGPKAKAGPSKAKEPSRPRASKAPAISRPFIENSDEYEEGGEAGGGQDKSKAGEGATKAPDTEVGREEPEAAAPTRKRLEDEDGVRDLREATQRLLPRHVFHTPGGWRGLFQHVAGMDVLLRGHQPKNPEADESRLDALWESQEVGLESNQRISDERRKLRESVLAFGAACMEAPYGSDIAATLLPAIMGFLKDIHVANVTKALVATPDCNMMAGLHEAMSMATTDGLYERDIASIDEATNTLQLDLRATFALETQGKLDAPSVISLGELKGTSADRGHTHQVLNYFHPARGLGRTEAESEKRACDAVLLQGCQEVTRARLPDDFVFLSRNEDEPPPIAPPVRAFDQASQCRSVLTEQNLLLRASGWVRGMRAKPTYTTQPERSGYSTGVFHNDQLTIADDSDDDSDPTRMGTVLQEALEEVGAKLTADWREGQERERIEYSDLIKTLETLAADRARHASRPPATDGAPRSPAIDAPPPIPPPIPPPSPTTAGLLEEGGQLSPDSHARWLADGAKVKPTIVPRKPEAKTGKGEILVPDSSDSSEEVPSPTKATAAKKDAPRGRPLEQPATTAPTKPAPPDLSQARDSSPEPGDPSDEDEDMNEDEPPLPPSRNPSNKRPAFTPTPPEVSNPRKRRAPSEASEPGDPDTPTPLPQQRTVSGQGKSISRDSTRKPSGLRLSTTGPTAQSGSKPRGSTAAPAAVRRKNIYHRPTRRPARDRTIVRGYASLSISSVPGLDTPEATLPVLHSQPPKRRQGKRQSRDGSTRNLHTTVGPTVTSTIDAVSIPPADSSTISQCVALGISLAVSPVISLSISLFVSLFISLVASFFVSLVVSFFLGRYLARRLSRSRLTGAVLTRPLVLADSNPPLK
ncbi:hypothetical protein FS749_001721, partial [Ceratobasidium sp. UAMH 11750]